MAALALIVACLASCQLSELIDRQDSQTTPSGDTSSDTEPEVKYEPMDFTKVDPLQYITVGQYKGIEITITYDHMTDEEFEETISKLLDESSYYPSITDRVTAVGDIANIDYKGFLNGEQFEGGTAQGRSITLGENSGYIDGFADGLVGVMPGETVTLELVFPEDYYEDLAGKPVTFEVTVNYIQGELVVPQLDSEFVSQYTGGTISDVEEFRQDYREKLQAERDEASKQNAMNELWSKIVDNFSIKQYPEQHVMYNYTALVDQYEYYAAYYGVDLETVLSLYGLTDDDLMLEAEMYTKQDLVLYAIAAEEGMTITEDEYVVELDKIAESVGAAAETVEAYYGKDYIMESLLWNEVLVQLYDWAEITEA